MNKLVYVKPNSKTTKLIKQLVKDMLPALKSLARK